MKKNIGAKYKLLLLIPMFPLMAGCAKHPNIIEGINADKLLIKDVNTGIERIYEYDITDVYKSERYKYLVIGDTVDISSYREYYDKNRVLSDKHSDMIIKKDLHIDDRREQMKFDSIKSKYFENGR